MPRPSTVPDHKDSESHRATVKSADRALALLEYLAEVKRASFSEISRDLGLPYSSTHQLLGTVADRAFIEYVELTKTYRLGAKVWTVGREYHGVGEIAQAAKPLMDALVASTRETVQLAALDGRHNVYLAVSESPHPMRLASSVGARLPAHATGLGKTLLAALGDEDVLRRLGTHELERFTEFTITNRPVLLGELRRVRQRGFGEDNGEYAVGCRCVAVPVRDAQGTAVAAMSVTVPTPRLSDRLMALIRVELAATVTELESVLKATSTERGRTL